MELQLIDHVEVPASLARHTNLLEKIGNVLLSPGYPSRGEKLYSGPNSKRLLTLKKS